MRIILLFTLLLAFACKGTDTKTESVTTLPESNYAVKIAINGMTCEGCENTIKTNISQLEGISSVEVSHSEGIAIINFNPNLVDTTAIKEKIVASGYSVVSITNN